MKTKFYVVSEEELFRLIKDGCYTVHTDNMIKVEVDDFLKSRKPIEEIYSGKFHYGDFLWKETIAYAILDKKLSDRNGKPIKIWIEEG